MDFQSNDIDDLENQLKRQTSLTNLSESSSSSSENEDNNYKELFNYIFTYTILIFSLYSIHQDKNKELFSSIFLFVLFKIMKKKKKKKD